MTRLLPRAGLAPEYSVARLLGREGDAGVKDIVATCLTNLPSNIESTFSFPGIPRLPFGSNFAKYPTSSSMSSSVGNCGDGAANANVSMSRRVAKVFSAMRIGP